jgi:hypothetical protein
VWRPRWPARRRSAPLLCARRHAWDVGRLRRRRGRTAARPATRRRGSICHATARVAATGRHRGPLTRHSRNYLYTAILLRTSSSHSSSISSQLASLPLSPRPTTVHIVHQWLKRRSMLLLLCINGVARQWNVMTAGITLGGEWSKSEEVGR